MAPGPAPEDMSAYPYGFTALGRRSPCRPARRLRLVGKRALVLADVFLSPRTRAGYSPGPAPPRGGLGLDGGASSRGTGMSPGASAGAGAEAAGGAAAGPGAAGAPSTSIRGSTRSSQRGIHQEAGPNRYMTAGTSSSRTIVASMRMLDARPTDSCLITTWEEVTKERNTAIMISAAQLITRPVLSRPMATARWWSRRAFQASWTRDSRNTS